MKKSFLIFTAILLMGGFHLSAQDTSSNGKALNFPANKYGISIGNSYEFTGIRMNFADENVKKINGLNVTLWFTAKNQNAVVNGISIGVIPTTGSMQYINLGLLGVGTARNLNGVSISGMIIGSGGHINGLSISGIMTRAAGSQEGEGIISGIAISGIGVFANVINGLAIGGLAVGSDGDINGVATGLACIYCEKNFRGIAVTGGYLKSEIFNGVAIAGYAKTNQMNGLSIALYNRTKELHGVQFGLLNHAENNPKGLRILPFINLHF